MFSNTECKANDATIPFYLYLFRLYLLFFKTYIGFTRIGEYYAAIDTMYLDIL